VRGHVSRAAGGRAARAGLALALLAALAPGARAASAPAPPVPRVAGSTAPVAKAGPAPATTAPPPAAGLPTYSEEVSVGWVLVPVIVRTHSGYLERLGRDDFELFVDHRPVRFRDFERRAEATTSIVLLQDLSGSMGIGGRLDASREALDFFLEHAKSGDEFAIATFAGNETQVDVPFTGDLEALREDARSWEAYGRTALHDAVAWLPQISVKGQNVKRAAILITDGVDNASTISATDAREVVRKAEIPVYVLGLESGDPYKIKPDGEKVYRYADVLNLLAAMTGGRYFSIGGPDEMKEACATIADDLRYEYILSFETSGAGDSRFRPIEVRVKSRKAAAVWTRKGYEGTSPATK